MSLRPRRAAPFVAGLAAALLLAGPSPAGAAVPGLTGLSGTAGDRLSGTGLLVGDGAPAPPEVPAASWLVADLDSGEVLAAKDAHGRYAPASSLKTLTALALRPRLDPERLITPTFDDVGVEGSKVGLVEGVAYPARELFAALLMVSGNDAANALATAAGGQQVTADLMNETARSLGALDTRAVNPHGLDAEGQVSSAHDLAVIARAGLADPDFRRDVSTRTASIGAPAGSPRIQTSNKNRLLRDYPGALGVKNGYTTRARASFVGAAERDGRRLVVTLLQADPQVFDEGTRLLDWGFAAIAAGAEGVGRLPASPAGPGGTGTENGGTGNGAPVDGPGERAPLGPTAAQAGPAGEPTGLPVTLAGMGLAAAALLVVRRPAPSSRSARRRPSALR